MSLTNDGASSTMRRTVRVEMRLVVEAGALRNLRDRASPVDQRERRHHSSPQHVLSDAHAEFALEPSHQRER